MNLLNGLLSLASGPGMGGKIGQGLSEGVRVPVTRPGGGGSSRVPGPPAELGVTVVREESQAIRHRGQGASIPPRRPAVQFVGSIYA